MDTDFSSIWLELTMKQGKQQTEILICQFYREFKQMGIEETGERECQWMRWALFMDQWEKAMEENKEIHCLGDANFD